MAEPACPAGRLVEVIFSIAFSTLRFDRLNVPKCLEMPLKGLETISLHRHRFNPLLNQLNTLIMSNGSSEFWHHNAGMGRSNSEK